MTNTDFILIEKIKKRDAAAFSIFYDRHNTNLLKKILYRINDSTRAEDMLQTLWLRIWEEPEFLRTNENGSAANFLHAYIHYQILDYYKKENKEVQTIDESIIEISDTEYFEILDKNSVEKILKMIEEVVATMPTTDRKIYDLRIKQNCSVSETAQMLNLKEKTVRNRLSVVLGSVRNELEGKYKLSKNTLTVIVCLEIISQAG